MQARTAGGGGGWTRWGVLALLLLGCRPGEGGSGSDAGVNLAGARCEALLPPEVREAAALGDATLGEEGRPCTRCGPLCTLSAVADGGGRTHASVAHECHPGLASGRDIQQRLEAVLAHGAVSVPGLGRAAAQRTVAPGSVQLVTWDDDTPCALVVTWVGPEPERVVELARGALRACTPEALAGRSPGGAAP